MKTTFSRRHFIQTSALAAGAAFSTPAFGSFNLDQWQKGRSISPFILGEDLLRLTQIADMDGLTRQALLVNRECFQLGKAWSISGKPLTALVQASRNLWKDPKESDRAQTQFALLCGWSAHRTFEQWLYKDDQAVSTAEDLSERTLYRDVHLMKMLQNADPHRPMIAIDRPLPGVDVASVANLFHLIQQRNLIRMHTIRPEFSDAEGWLDQFLNYYHQLKKDNAQYAEVYCNPVAEKVQKHIRQNNFYHADDQIIQVARKLQMGLPLGHHGSSWMESAPASIYGKALGEAFQKIRTCSLYITGNATEQALQAAFGG